MFESWIYILQPNISADKSNKLVSLSVAKQFLVGDFNHLEKYQSVGMIIPNILKIKHVPNHQPVNIFNHHHVFFKILIYKLIQPFPTCIGTTTPDDHIGIKCFFWHCDNIELNYKPVLNSSNKRFIASLTILHKWF